MRVNVDQINDLNLTMHTRDRNYGNHAFLILTDCVSESMIRLYHQVKAATFLFGETFIAYHDKLKTPETRLDRYNTYMFTDSVLSDLGYTPLRKTLLPGSNHFPILKFHLDNPEYDYYWCIEDDVVFNGEWSSFFNQVIKKIKYDFISSHIKYYKDTLAPDWQWWYSLSKVGEEIDLNDRLMSLNPIYSLSKRAAKFLDQSLKDGWIGHHEVLIISLLLKNKFTIKDFGGDSTFVPIGFNGKFYNKETYLYRPVFQTPGKLLNKIYHPVKSPFKVTADFKYKISFCITGTKMLNALKQTLIKNIEDNSEYENYEFIVLDHAESDTGKWIKDCMSTFIDNGKLVFYNSYQKRPYAPNRAKNIVFKLASGDILCYIDSDQFTGKGFSKQINEHFKSNSDIFMAPLTFVPPDASARLQSRGILCFKKEDFLHIKGFAEEIKDSDSGNSDFITRMEQTKIKKDSQNETIASVNRDLLRFPVENLYMVPDRILVQHLDTSTSKVIFMCHTGAFQMGTITNNANRRHADPRYSYVKRKLISEYTLKKIGWVTGRWCLADNDEDLILRTENRREFKLRVQESYYEKLERNKQLKFYVLNDLDQKRHLIDFYHQSNNPKPHDKMTSKCSASLNPTGFGKAIVQQNFNSDFPIITS